MIRVLKARLKVDQHAEEIGAGLVSGEGDFRGNLSQGTEVAVLEAKWGSRLLEKCLIFLCPNCGIPSVLCQPSLVSVPLCSPLGTTAPKSVWRASWRPAPP